MAGLKAASERACVLAHAARPKSEQWSRIHLWLMLQKIPVNLRLNNEIERPTEA